MAKKLVIVESPAKAKTINKILGHGYSVKSSMGHVRDLPVKSLGVDVANGFALNYEVVRGRKKTVDELAAAAAQCEAIFLAPDPDREGEAIAWHLKEILAKGKANAGKPFYRVTYNEITPRAVQAAFENPGRINMHRVDAQQARRVVDRLVGYKVSPLLWKRVQRGLSAGRVQSVALRLLCEREQDIQAFKPEPYWVFGARVRKQIAPTDPFTVKLTKINGEKAHVRQAAEAESIRDDLAHGDLRVAAIRTRTVNRNAYPPFITSTLQQAASTFCGFSPKRTMDLAQKLYEGINFGDGPAGLITYMRTDSVNLSQDAVNDCRDFIRETYGPDYLPEHPNRFRSRGGAQEAHEAIRPTDVRRTPDQMKGILDEPSLKLYRLIWQRFVACQMPPARIAQRTVEILARRTPTGESGQGKDEGPSYLFTATASDVRFDGHRRVTGEKDPKAEDGDQVDALPVLNEGEPLVCLELLMEEKQTQPPSRFSEAALVKALEANGVGRPSTYAQILSTLQQRRYVELRNRTLFPSELGMRTSAFLTAELGALFDVRFTADLEQQLDTIEEGHVDWIRMLQAFNERLSDWLEAAREPPADEGKVRALLEALKAVRQWLPPVTRGKRTYSDERFVASIEEQVKEGRKPVSPRQLEALAKIAANYREETPGIREALECGGFDHVLATPPPAQPRKSSIRKLELLRDLELDERGRGFVDSLAEHVGGGRSLSDRQRAALDRIVMQHAARIPDFEAQRETLDLEEQAAPADDHESGPLLDLMSQVKTWNEPVKRGKREFNDKTFYESLARQFEQRHALSDRQRAALKKMVRRYRRQIPDYEAVESRLGLAPAKKPES